MAKERGEGCVCVCVSVCYLCHIELITCCLCEYLIVSQSAVSVQLLVSEQKVALLVMVLSPPYNHNFIHCYSSQQTQFSMYTCT